MGGVRRVDRALEDAAGVIRGSRPNVPKVVIVLAAGRHATVPGAKSLDAAAKPLRDLGAKTYVIAIGDSVNKPQLRPIIQRPEDIIPVDGFNRLRPLSPSIGREVAKGASEYRTKYMILNIDSVVQNCIYLDNNTTFGGHIVYLWPE